MNLIDGLTGCRVWFNSIILITFLGLFPGVQAIKPGIYVYAKAMRVLSEIIHVSTMVTVYNIYSQMDVFFPDGQH